MYFIRVCVVYPKVALLKQRHIPTPGDNKMLVTDSFFSYILYINSFYKCTIISNKMFKERAFDLLSN